MFLTFGKKKAGIIDYLLQFIALRSFLIMVDDPVAVVWIPVVFKAGKKFVVSVFMILT